MWNYNFVIPSILVLLIFMLYYFIRPRLPIRMNYTFLNLLMVDIFTILFDFVSSKADEAHLRFSVPLLYFLNLGFFVFYLARIFWFYLFTLDVLNLHGKPHRWIYQLTPLVFAFSELVTLSSPITHAVFSIDAEGYHRGPLYNILYVCSFFYIFAALVMLITYCKGLSPFDLLSLAGYHLILLAGNVVRFLLPQYLVMNTFCLMAIIVIYLSFENPDLYISLRGHTFNARAFRDLLTEWHGQRPYHILGVVICNYNEKRGIYGSFQMDQSVVLINRYLTKTFPGTLVFYLRNGCFAMVGTEGMDCTAIRQTIAKRFRKPWATSEIDLSLSAGFVQADSDSHLDTVDRLVNTLLIALDNAGRAAELPDEVTISETVQNIEEELAVKRTLELALEEDRVEVFLQPLIDSRTRRMVAAEALARIRDEEGKLISPGIFIPLAEKNGRIVQLGEQVLRKTCRLIHENDLSALGMGWINVNLSPLQCMNKDLAQHFAQVLLENQVSARSIHLEITEESMVDYSLLKNQIDALQEAGFEFALDDYGSGYSNLTRVRRYPFKHIKIDMAVVADYCTQRDQLLPTLIQVFKKMNYTITAEGIEDLEMADALTSIGCDYLQGFYFSRPIPFDEFLEKYADS
jgi:EAL domain-containing protein (putative c-di-GMP-specific phosphodiesterase class I)